MNKAYSKLKTGLDNLPDKVLLWLSGEIPTPLWLKVAPVLILASGMYVIYTLWTLN